MPKPQSSRETPPIVNLFQEMNLEHGIVTDVDELGHRLESRVRFAILRPNG